MALIGNLGSLITFEVSSDKVLTFNNLNQTVKGRWATHSLIGSKPMPEFLGPDLRSITFQIFVTVEHGVSPRVTMERIENAAETGTPYPLVIGGRLIGKNQWRVTQMSEAWGAVIRGGIIASANLSVTLEEYV